jgi:hypothetical protein
LLIVTLARADTQTWRKTEVRLSGATSRWTLVTPNQQPAVKEQIVAKRNYREIQQEYVRRTAFKKTTRPLREYHRPEPVAEMLERLSEPLENGCRIWRGKIGTGGYAYIAYRKEADSIQNGYRRRYHRKAATVAYELKYGPVPKGKEVSHVCPGGANRRCVNPDHLIAETHSENLKRRRPFDHRTWGGLCKRGHVLPPLEERNQNGSCPICYAEYQARWKAKNKQYDVDYREANKDRINAQRRARRARRRMAGPKVV